MKKRILSGLCAIAMVVTSITISNPTSIDVIAASGTISLDTVSINGVLGYKSEANGGTGYLNIPYTGVASDFVSNAQNFLDVAFSDKYITYGGGMTSADLLDGVHSFYVATDSIIQFNWSKRTVPFEEGWSFTIAEGALLPYVSTAGTKYMPLDKEYTFTVLPGNANYDCIFSIKGRNVTTFSLGRISLWGNSLSGTTQIPFTDSNVANYNTTYTYIHTDESYEEYIRITGVDHSELVAESIKIRYVMDGSERCIQIEDWGSLRDTLGKGDQIIFYEGFPIYYKDTFGNEWKATLDGTYVYECQGSNAENTQVFYGVNLSGAVEYGIVTSASVVSTSPQSATNPEQFRNISFDSASSGTISHNVNVNVLEDTVARDYVKVSGCTVEEAMELGFVLRFVPNANVLQIGFGESMVDAIEVGDTILLKKGMPIVYLYDGTLQAAVLDSDYIFTITANDGTKVSLIYTVAGTYSLKGTARSPIQEGGYKYWGLDIVADAFADAASRGEGKYEFDKMQDYVEFSEHSANDALSDGSHVRWYTYDASIYQGLRLYSNLEFNTGEVLMLKKGLPISYNTTGGKNKTATLSQDYGFVFDGNKFNYDASLGNEETADTSFKETTIAKVHSTSTYNEEESRWYIYTVPMKPSVVPGTPWSTTFDATYEIDGTSYNGVFVRANNTEGLALRIPGSELPANADGVTVTIKAGEYAASDRSAGIQITEDFTFYLIDGVVTTDYDFNDPAFTSSVYCDVDHATYVIADADTVTIDGVTYSRGDTYAETGVHSLTYVLHNHEYTRQLIFYHLGDLDDDNDVDIKDHMAGKKHIANVRELSLSGAKALDMDNNGEITAADGNLLGRYLVTESGVLAVFPVDGTVTAFASEAAENLITDYYVTKADLYKTGQDIYYREPAVLKWFAYDDVEEYTVAIWSKKDMSDKKIFTTGACTLEVENLFAGTDYYWTITAGDYVTPVQVLHTADTIRTLTIEGVSNTRDGGGWPTVDGKKVKQGMFYRGGKLEDITSEGLAAFRAIGVKTDLDLRNNTETSATVSPLGADVTYVNHSGPYYWSDGGNGTGINAEAYREALVNEIRLFADEDNYPIYVHCSLGRDRTGTLCFLINALCGVGEQDLCLDYEFSFLSVTGNLDNQTAKNMMSTFGYMYDKVKEYAPNGTMAEATEAFMLSIGVTQEEIDAIRTILVEE